MKTKPPSNYPIVELQLRRGVHLLCMDVRILFGRSLSSFDWVKPRRTGQDDALERAGFFAGPKLKQCGISK